MDLGLAIALGVAALPIIGSAAKFFKWVVELVFARIDKRRAEEAVSPPSPPVADIPLVIPPPAPVDDHADDAIEAYKGRALTAEARESDANERARRAEKREELLASELKTVNSLLDNAQRRVRSLERQLESARRPPDPQQRPPGVR